ncbi:MAG: phage holin family protein [Lachnospiraceae bacterium]|nr:phage holin family protein [Lachnospiraceae bacterium]
MDLTFLTNYISPVVLGICLCVGYALKIAFKKFNNQYIPLAMLTLGCIINILINMSSGINADVVLGGMISGLASTGLYEMLRNLINKDGKKEVQE